jgi:feruloyl esterase
MGHCSGGEGPDKFDKIGALEDWVERGVVPEKLLAAQESEGKVVRTRPVCAYPAAPRYRGSGDVNEAASFVCAAR